MTLRTDARAILDAAIAAADARAAVIRALSTDGDALAIGGERIPFGSFEKLWVIGAGKAAWEMAVGARDVLGGLITGGSLTICDGCGWEVAPLELWEAAHPVPDTRGLAGAVDALRCARAARADDLVLCLLSGGASALWPCPVAGVSLTDVRAVTTALLHAGAGIRELNAVRRHLSRISGGGLARAAAPARVVTLAVSDVVGSPLDVIASGPTVPDPTTYADALDVLAGYEIAAPPAVLAWLHARAAGQVEETPKPGDAIFARASAHVVASNADALRGAAERARALGYHAEIVADDLEGEAREVAPQIARLAVERQAALAPGDAPIALLLGGETTVTVRGRGRGGRNQELALALAVELAGRLHVVAAALGTDGVDGPTHAAGAIVDSWTVRRGEAHGLDVGETLARNDSHTFLRATGDVVFTGPTRTNVADVVLILAEAGEA